jgi:beta-phosphoglucomutase-like phosphatase (HAD superfamily)
MQPQVRPTALSASTSMPLRNVPVAITRPRLFALHPARGRRTPIFPSRFPTLKPIRATSDPSHSANDNSDEEEKEEKSGSYSGNSDDASSADEDIFVDRPWLKNPPSSLPTSSSSLDQIGAEYGEGFLQFRLSGEKTRLDVDTLNEELQVKGAARIRHQTMAPDEAYGLIFDFDDVIVDTRALQRAAWQNVATAENLRYPEIERAHMFEMRPERAAMHVLQWTQSMQRAQELAWLVATEYSAMIQNDIETPLPGVVEWLSVMSKTNVPCALVTAIDKTTATGILEKLSVRQYFGALVTADDDMETIAQRYLSAAIKLNRPPNQCVVFAATPAQCAAAHNCTMRCVAVIGTHTAPQLRSADLTISSMTELSVINLRRLFANSNSGTEFMDLKKQRTGQGTNKRKLRHATDGE